MEMSRARFMNKTTNAPFKRNKDTHSESKVAAKTSEERLDNENMDLKIDSSTSQLQDPDHDNGSVEVDGLDGAKGDAQAGQVTENVLASESHLFAQHFKELLESGINQILKAFDQKLAYDTTKQQQIDHLHAELQLHRTDLIARTNRPLVNGLIRLHDDVGKLVDSLRKKPAEELEPEVFFKAFQNIQVDIEMLLDQNGIVSFTEQDEKFEPRRQRLVNNVRTSEEQLIGTIAERLRPGFEQTDDLIQKERVSVYVPEKATNRYEGDFHEDEKNEIRKASDSIESRNLEENND